MQGRMQSVSRLGSGAQQIVRFESGVSQAPVGLGGQSGVWGHGKQANGAVASHLTANASSEAAPTGSPSSATM